MDSKTEPGGSQPISSVIIVGGGVAGWTAAVSIAHALRGQGLKIIVVDNDAPVKLQAMATLPITLAFHQRLGIDEQSLMRETGATFRLGTQFRDWLKPGQRYFHPLGAHGASIEFVHFHNFAAKARQMGDPTPFSDYSLCAAAAKLGRFTHPSSDPNSILSTLVYAHHLDCDLYAALMRKHAEANGVTALKARVSDVDVQASNGFIRSLALDNGAKLEADLFIDCSGNESILMGRALQVGYEDWSEWLPANRVVSASGPATDAAPRTGVTAVDVGWHQCIPLHHRQAHKFVFNGHLLGDDEAIDAQQKAAGLAAGSETQISGFRNGHRLKFWSGNCIALGPAAGFLEPLEDSGHALLQSGLMRLMSMFPDKSCNPLIADEYNQVTLAEYENIRDFLILHYQATGRRESPFWNAYRAQPVPDSLAHKIRLFKSHGQVAFYEEESFPETSWVSVWLGQDQWPAGYDLMLDNYDFERLKTRFEQMRTIIRQAAQSMPEHPAYLARFCAGTAAATANS